MVNPMQAMLENRRSTATGGFPERYAGIGHLDDLEVYREAHRMAFEVYQQSAALPLLESCGLAAEMRRAAVSVPFTLEAGLGRTGKREKLQCYIAAQVSIAELRERCMQAMDRGCPGSLFEALTASDRIAVRLHSMMQRIREGT